MNINNGDVLIYRHKLNGSNTYEVPDEAAIGAKFKVRDAGDVWISIDQLNGIGTYSNALYVIDIRRGFELEHKEFNDKLDKLLEE